MAHLFSALSDDYFVTFSNHFTMANIATIEMPQTTTKTVHVAEIEMLL